jgi:hypothetical protein
MEPGKSRCLQSVIRDRLDADDIGLRKGIALGRETHRSQITDDRPPMASGEGHACLARAVPPVNSRLSASGPVRVPANSFLKGTVRPDPVRPKETAGVESE